MYTCNFMAFSRKMRKSQFVGSSIVAIGMTAGEINPLALSYGYDQLRFIRPVFIGDTIHVRVTITEKRDHKRPEQGIVVERCEVLNQKQETVLVCDHLLLVRRTANPHDFQPNDHVNERTS